MIKRSFKFLALTWSLAVSCLAHHAEAKSPAIAPEFINFGYVQNSAVLPYVQFEAFTHIAPPFVDFVADGSLTQASRNGFINRNPDLRAGGAASRAGTKVILCVRNQSFNETILTSIANNMAYRNRLVNEVVALANSDPYCGGVNYDFEFAWGPEVRDALTDVIQKTRAGLAPGKELSVYVHASYSASRWDVPGIIDHVDYVLYSTYDWGTGNNPHAISDFDNCLPHLWRYMNDGIPPEKMVLTWSSYGRRYYSEGPIDYNQPGTNPRGSQSQGFYDTMYNIHLRPSNGGPFTPTYVRGDESVKYNYQMVRPGTGVLNNIVAVGETPESIEYKVHAALNFPGYNGDYRGVRLGGVGWWSMMWVSDYWRDYGFGTGYEFGSSFASYNPLTATVVPRAPYYRHIDLQVQELLKKRGQKQFQLESFEAENPHWRDPNESPDTVGAALASNFGWFNAPAGAGRPPATTRAGRLYFEFNSGSGNKLFMRYEMLNNRKDTTVIDTLSALALVSKNTRISGYYHVGGNYSNSTLRLAALDGLRQVEVSKPISLPTSAGWYQFTWDLNDPAQVEGRTTAEPNFNSGNGTIDTASPDARDISFLGFIIEGGGSGSIYFDELTYEHRTPGGTQYAINEFRYGQNSSEFVEIAGPPGPLPAGLQVISYKSTDGSPHKVTSLAGRSIPPGGLLVIGDIGVPGATGSTGFTPANWATNAADFPAAPGSIQIYDSISGAVHDSVVYGAYNGVGDLARIQTRRVTGEGYGWLGGLGSGTSTISLNGPRYSFGRTRDGQDTDWNQRDFSFMTATPGQPNFIYQPSDDPITFDSIPAGMFQTYRNITLVDPLTATLPASPSGGNAYRCYDSTGGGVIGVIGDGEMGGTRGLDISGEIFIPATLDPAQAVAVGFCGSQGSVFFSSATNTAGYEDGYWLIYENGNVSLNDGQPDHPGTFQFVMAHNDKQHTGITTRLDSSAPPVTPNTWATFRLRLDPEAAPNEQLVAQLNGSDVYRGAIPQGGRRNGAFMVGFREPNGITSPREGTWVDNIKINYARPPARVSNYELY